MWIRSVSSWIVPSEMRPLENDSFCFDSRSPQRTGPRTCHLVDQCG
ncbi:hypothetical protein WG66_006075, partial [Moniliophthora roreri]